MAIALPVIEALFTTGQTLYAVLRDRLTGKTWNNTGSAWEVYNSAHWTQYAIALAEQTSSGYYTATRPTGTAGFLTSESIYQQAGGSPALGDTPATNLGYSHGQNVAAISGDAANAPTNLEANLLSQVQGQVAAGTITAQIFPTNLLNANTNAFSGRVLLMVSGAAVNMAALIAQYNPTNGVITLSAALAAAPSANDQFIIA